MKNEIFRPIFKIKIGVNHFPSNFKFLLFCQTIKICNNIFEKKFKYPKNSPYVLNDKS